MSARWALHAPPSSLFRWPSGRRSRRNDFVARLRSPSGWGHCERPDNKPTGTLLGLRWPRRCIGCFAEGRTAMVELFVRRVRRGGTAFDALVLSLPAATSVAFSTCCNLCCYVAIINLTWKRRPAFGPHIACSSVTYRAVLSCATLPDCVVIAPSIGNALAADVRHAVRCARCSPDARTLSSPLCMSWKSLGMRQK